MLNTQIKSQTSILPTALKAVLTSQFHVDADTANRMRMVQKPGHLASTVSSLEQEVWRGS